MTERLGLVLGTNDDRTAQVATDQDGFCRGCKETGMCRMCLSGSRITATVYNTVDAQKGDVVSIDDGRFALWQGAATLYVIPVLWLMIGAVVGAGLGIDWRIGEVGGAVLVGFSGCAIGLLILFIVSKSLESDREARPRIVCVVDSNREKGVFMFEEHAIAPGDIHCSTQ